MMTRLERLLSVGLLLSARRRLRAGDLAEQFEVSLRTVYRDIQALQDAGFPVVGTAGDGYRLPPTTQLRPLAFSPDEAEALTTGARLLDSLVDSSLKDRLRSAIAKIEAVLSSEALARVAESRDRVLIKSPDRVTGPMGLLLEAVNRRKVLAITYDGIARGKKTKREVEPLGLVRYANVWLIPAYCRLRQDLRVFRADRIIEARQTEATFTPRPGLTLQDFIRLCEKEAFSSPSKNS
ncbi:MAG: YafY family transcriptional regulator [Nitrospirae bacterium]|nr:YafY family transcriptional regulator [Nitrospirota bacterium]